MAADVLPFRAPAETSETSETDTDALFARLKRCYSLDLQKTRIWREEAIEDFRFRDGDQWTDAEKQILRDQMRPVVVFNRTGVMVDAVVGSEIGNRREVRFIPREQADAKPNELLTSAAEWFRDQCDAEDEESEAFKDAITAGMGWTETRLDFEESEDGEPKIERIDPFEMVWDANASKANLVDSKRRYRVRKVSIEDAKEMFPDVEPDDLNAAWADDGTDEDADIIDRRNRYRGDDDDDAKNAECREVTLVACQYWETETYHKAAVPNLQSGQMEMQELSADDHAVVKKRMQTMGVPLQSVRLTRKVVMQCFLGASGLLGKPTKTQTKSFTWNCVTGLKDNDKGTFYGIVRRAKDPQRWFNKWLSQNMHILNSQAKGGIMVEEGVFEDIREAERTWTRPDAITVVASGTLSNPNSPKLQQKPVAQTPVGIAQLMQMADDFIVKCTGINMELLGMRDAQQAGVLEMQRRQSGITILASFFDSLRRYRKIQGRGLLALIQDYLSDGRLVRIVGDDQARYVPLTKEATASGEYDIIVDDSPSSPNEKERTWGLLQPLLPMLKDVLGPKEGLILAEYAPLPASLVEKLKESVKASQEGHGQPSPQEQVAMQLQQAQLQLEQQKLANESAKIANDQQKNQNDLQIAMMQSDNERRRIEADTLQAIADANRPQPAPRAEGVN